MLFRSRGESLAIVRGPAARSYTAPNASSRSFPNGSYARPQSAPRGYQNRSYVNRGTAPRAYDGRAYQGQSRAVPRSYYAPSYRGGGYNYGRPGYRGYGSHPTMVRPYFSRSYFRPFGWAAYHPYHFARPYYAFSPWLSLGFGLWVGYPVAYPWVYLGDYRPTVFGTYAGGSYAVAPGVPSYQPLPAPSYQAAPVAPSYQVAPDSSDYGGASFDIQPADADVFVDGQYVGPVGNFSADSEPLTLGIGQHRIAIQREGYRPLEWDVTIEAGMVIPYRGTLERQ